MVSTRCATVTPREVNENGKNRNGEREDGVATQREEVYVLWIVRRLRVQWPMMMTGKFEECVWVRKIRTASADGGEEEKSQACRQNCQQCERGCCALRRRHRISCSHVRQALILVYGIVLDSCLLC